MFQRRHPVRFTWRLARRAHTRSHVRERWRAPDDFGTALTTLRRAMRSYRRLARLAPLHFDTTLIERERLLRARQQARDAACERALDKIYGPPTEAERAARRSAEFAASLPPRLSPRTEGIVLQEWENFQRWRTIGHAAFTRHQRRHVHHIPTLGRIAQLFELAFDFQWIATGADWRRPELRPAPALPSADDEDADLHRAYGMTAVASPMAPPPPVAANASGGPYVSSGDSANLPAVQPPPPVAAPPSAPSVLPPDPPPRRCDAWSRWARQSHAHRRYP